MQKDNNRINDFSRPNLLKHILACHVFTYEVKYFQHQLSEKLNCILLVRCNGFSKMCSLLKDRVAIPS